jgi:hypothetical protein
MPNRGSNPWQAAYVCAALQTDPREILSRICAALTAIEVRLRSPIQIDGPEHMAIRSARKELIALEAELGCGPENTVPLLWESVNRN